MYLYIYIMRGKKDATTFPKMGNVVASFFSSHNIYSAQIQRIEHCSTRKSTCRLPIYIYIYIFFFYYYFFINSIINIHFFFIT